MPRQDSMPLTGQTKLNALTRDVIHGQKLKPQTLDVMIMIKILYKSIKLS